MYSPLKCWKIYYELEFIFLLVNDLQPSGKEVDLGLPLLVYPLIRAQRTIVRNRNFIVIRVGTFGSGIK